MTLRLPAGKMIGLILSLVGVMSWAQDSHPSATRADFVSDVSFVVGTYSPAQRVHTPAAMANSARQFLDSLTAAQRARCVGDLKSKQRRDWTNLPARPNADGVRMGDLSDTQCRLALEMLSSLLSEQGYQKMRDIMLADDQLLNVERPRPGFGTENFSIVLFGTPSETEPWAFQLDGHHIGANISIHGDKLTMSPSFIGTQPHAFSVAGREIRPFENETGLAHQLAMSLTDEQVLQAVQNPSRVRILTGPGQDGQVPNLDGVPCRDFSDAQKETLLSLIRQWVGDLPEAQATARMEQLAGEVDQMKFGWNGNREPNSNVSYTIQSPSLIIEYACQNLGGNPLDHLHSNYRDPTNEYGGQLK